MWAML